MEFGTMHEKKIFEVEGNNKYMSETSLRRS